VIYDVRVLLSVEVPVEAASLPEAEAQVTELLRLRMPESTVVQVLAKPRLREVGK